jgi:hypothetical protein
VIHFPSGSRGDYQPRKLVGYSKVSLGELGLQSIVETRLPEASITFNSQAKNSFLVELPPAMSLTAGAEALKKEPSIEEVLPQFLSSTSTAMSLHLTTSDNFVHLSPLITYLVAQDEGSLRPFQQDWVVRIRARGRNVEEPVDSRDILQVLSVEKIKPHRITLEGTLSLHGDRRDCLLLHRDNGDLVALLGSQATRLSQTTRAGQRVRIQAEDLGLSTQSCSGGFQVRVETFQPL